MLGYFAAVAIGAGCVLAYANAQPHSVAAASEEGPPATGGPTLTPAQATQNFPAAELAELAHDHADDAVQAAGRRPGRGDRDTSTSSRRPGTTTSRPSSRSTRRRGPSSTGGSTPCCRPCGPRPRTTPPKWPPCRPWPSRSADRRSPCPSHRHNRVVIDDPGLRMVRNRSRAGCRRRADRPVTTSHGNRCSAPTASPPSPPRARRRARPGHVLVRLGVDRSGFRQPQRASVEWMRNNHLGGVVDAVERRWYDHHQAKVGGTPAVTRRRRVWPTRRHVAHVRVAADVNGAVGCDLDQRRRRRQRHRAHRTGRPAGAIRTERHCPHPPRWSARPPSPCRRRRAVEPDRPRLERRAGAYATLIRPDDVHTSVLDAVVWIDPARRRAAARTRARTCPAHRGTAPTTSRATTRPA